MKRAAASKKTPGPKRTGAVDQSAQAEAFDSNFDKLISVIEQQNQVIEKKSGVIEAQKKRIEILEEYLRLERARRFGPSSEKSTLQIELFNAAEHLVEQNKLAEEPQSPREPGQKKGRKGLSKSLPRHQIHLNLNEDEKAGALDTFYTVVKEELDIVPAKVRVIEYLQEKAVFVEADDQRRLNVAELPKHPLGKCIASLSLLDLSFRCYYNTFL